MLLILGGVIVGSVEGNRIWGKDIKSALFTAVEVHYEIFLCE